MKEESINNRAADAQYANHLLWEGNSQMSPGKLVRDVKKIVKILQLPMI
jgi:hypothetical protein